MKKLPAVYYAKTSLLLFCLFAPALMHASDACKEDQFDADDKRDIKALQEEKQLTEGQAWTILSLGYVKILLEKHDEQYGKHAAKCAEKAFDLGEDTSTVAIEMYSLVGEFQKAEELKKRVTIEKFVQEMRPRLEELGVDKDFKALG